MILVLAVTFCILLLLNVPVAYSLGIASLFALVHGGFPITLIIQRMTAAVDSFVLLAVPLFILAGNLMAHGGISHALVEFADSLVRSIRGGLAHVNIVTSMFFAGITGAAVADTSAIGSVLIPPMLKLGYHRDFTIGVTATSSTIGVIIPPSIPMVIFGVVTGVSVGRLFLGGFIPGVLIGVTLMVISYIISVRRGYEKGVKLPLKEIAKRFWKSLPALMMPVIILGGILLGVFTPTEVAAIAVVYALAVGMLVYRAFGLRDLPRILFESAKTTAVVMLMVAGAFLYAWVITRERIPFYVVSAITRVTTHPILILLLVTAVYLVAGMFMDLGANIVILVPVLFPAMKMLGIDPVHFGLITVIGLAIGLVTPPVGACLFLACEISKGSLLEGSWGSLPFILGILAILVLIIVFPQLVLWIPSTFM